MAQSGDGHPTASRRWLGRRPDGPGAEPLGNDFTPCRMTDSVRVGDEGTGPGGGTGGGACGCLLFISFITSADGLARPSDVNALMALLYRPSCTACRALLILLEEEADADRSLRLERDWAFVTASDHKMFKSPSDHCWRRVFTVRKISRHRRRCPAAGLDNTHFASIKSLDQLERSLGEFAMEERQSLRVWAHLSLAPFGTW